MLKKHITTILTLLLCFTLLCSGCSKGQTTGEKAGKYSNNKQPLVITTQAWTEPQILGEIARQLIEAKMGIPCKMVELESAVIQWGAFKGGQVDVWPDYVSDGFMLVLKDNGMRKPDEIYKYVKKEFKDRFNADWLDLLGFNNNYELAVTPETARKYNLKTYSDLAKVSKNLTLVCDANYVDRADCFPLIYQNYGIDYKDKLAMSSALLKYTALNEKKADVISCYTTDAKVKEMGLVVLEDDKHITMPFNGAFLINGEAAKKYPDLEKTLNSLAGKIPTEKMREMNYLVEIKNQKVEDVAHNFLKDQGLIN